MKKILAACFLLSVLLVLGLACDSASPVAPSGTLLTVSASPTEITSTGESTVRATALRANGSPVNPGTIIRFETTLGTIDEQAESDEQGVARATLVGDGRIGTATVTARSGSAEAATVEIQIGRVAANVSLQATPSQVTEEEGGTVTLLAVVRDNDGEPLADATANFQTEVGTLDSLGAILRTSDAGEARDTLRVTAQDVAPITANSFSVTVIVGSGESTTQDTASVSISRCAPEVDISAANVGNNTAEIFNNSSGQRPITWQWDFGDDAINVPPDAEQLEDPPPVEYENAGFKTIRLTATNACGQGTGLAQVTVEPNPPA